MNKYYQKINEIFNGYIEDNQSDWKNRIVGKKEGVLLADAKGIKYIHVGYPWTAATFLQQEVFLSIKYQKEFLVMMFFVVDFLIQVLIL